MAHQAWPGARIARAIFCERLGLPPLRVEPSDFSRPAVQMLVDNRLGSLAWHHVGALAPKPVARRLAAVYALAGEQVRRHERLIAEVRERLAGIPFLVLKGVPVARWLYGDARLRPSVDVDILVAPRDAEAVRRALSAGGLRPAHPPSPLHGQAWVATDGRNVDLHTEAWSSRIEAEGLFARKRQLADLGVAVPCDEDQAALLAAHYVADLGSQLMNLLDVLLAVQHAGRPAVVEPLLRVTERDAARWLEAARTVDCPLPWRPLDAFWARVSPARRILLEDVRSTLLVAYVNAALRPGHALSCLNALVWPAVPSRRWRGVRGWRVARVWSYLIRTLSVAVGPKRRDLTPPTVDLPGDRPEAR